MAPTSPYLNRPFRSLEEIQAERAADPPPFRIGQRVREKERPKKVYQVLDLQRGPSRWLVTVRPPSGRRGSCFFHDMLEPADG